MTDPPAGGSARAGPEGGEDLVRAAVGLEQELDLGGRHGSREVVALSVVAALGPQSVDLRRLLDPFGQGDEAEGAPSSTRVWTSAVASGEPVISDTKVRSILSTSTGNWRRYASDE